MGKWSRFCWTIQSVLGYICWLHAFIVALCWFWLQEDRWYLICCNTCWYAVNLSKEFELIGANGEFILEQHFASYSSSFLFLDLVLKSLKLDLLWCWTMASLIYCVCIELQWTPYNACTKLCNIICQADISAKK